MLNTHYAGMVHAEAFNSDGKTHISTARRTRRSLSASASPTTGPKTVTYTLKQLSRYSTWRDVKLAIIFFIGRKNASSEAIKRIKDTVEGDPQFRAWLPGNRRASLPVPGAGRPGLEMTDIW